MYPMQGSFLRSSDVRHVVLVSLVLLLWTVHATELFFSLPCAPSNPNAPNGVVVDVDTTPNQHAAYTLVNCTTNDGSGLVVLITQRYNNRSSSIINTAGNDITTMVTVHVVNAVNVSLEVANISSAWKGRLYIDIVNVTNLIPEAYVVAIRNASLSAFALSALDVWTSGGSGGIAIVQNSTLTALSSLVMRNCSSTASAVAAVFTAQHSSFANGSTFMLSDSVLSSATAAMSIADTDISGGSMVLMWGCSLFGAKDVVLVTNSALVGASQLVVSGCLVSIGGATVVSAASSMADPVSGIRFIASIVAQGSMVTVAHSHFAFEHLSSSVALRISDHSAVTGNSSVVIDGTCTYSLNVSTMVVLEGVTVSSKSILSFSGPSTSSSSSTGTMLWASDGSCFVINGSSVFDDATVLIINWRFTKAVPHITGLDSVLYIEGVEMILTTIVVSSETVPTSSTQYDVAWWGPIVLVTNVRGAVSSRKPNCVYIHAAE